MLRILALETSELTGSVAAAVGDNLLAEIDLEPQKRSAQSLAPAMQTLLKHVGWRPRDVQLVAVTTGPGSFTGLRVGVATAKVFSYAVGAEVLGISTLEVIAAAAPLEVARVSAAVDAQRGDVVAQDFQRQSSKEAADPFSFDARVSTSTPTQVSELNLMPLAAARLLPLTEWLAGLPAGFAVTGPILKKWTDPFPLGMEVLREELWRPRAANVARLAYRDYLAGRRDDPFRLLPIYSRPSAAEEKWAKRGQKFA